jgi:hypothetical protein
MIQVPDVVSANLNFYWVELITSECTVVFTFASFVNWPIPYLMGSVCGATLIYLHVCK